MWTVLRTLKFVLSIPFGDFLLCVDFALAPFGPEKNVEKIGAKMKVKHDDVSLMFL